MKSFKLIYFNKLRGLFSKRIKVKMLLLVAGMILAAFLEVLGIGMIPGFVSIVTDPALVLDYEPLKELLQRLEITTSRSLLLWGGGALIVVFIIKNIYLIGYFYIERNFLNNRLYDISHKLMKAYMLAPYTFHLQRNTSELLRNINEECKILVERVLMPIFEVLREGVIVLSILIFLLAVEPLITLVVFVLIGGIAGAFLFFTQGRVKKYGAEEQGYRNLMIKAVNQGFGGIKDVRVLNRETFFIEKFRGYVRRRTKLMAFMTFIAKIPKPIIETFAVIGIMVIVLIMVAQERPLNTIIPVMGLFAMATVRLMPAIQKISTSLTTVIYNLVSVNPVFDDIEALRKQSKKTLDSSEHSEKLTFGKIIEIKDVSFNYPNSNEKALKEVSLNIPKGEAVALVGSSGAGKSTLVDLLLGLIEPSSGKILVDGVDIYDNLSSWQLNIGYIPQAIFISDESIRDNIAFGIPEKEIDDGKVWEAVKLAQLEDHINRLPKGLDTIIGERGKLLSGGQIQRIGIARALYNEPQVLVMDEATSALDNTTEKYIMQSIERLKGDKTIIMIAHRLSTVQNCDMLYFMQNGKIIQKGTYKELLTENIEFRNMAKS